MSLRRYYRVIVIIAATVLGAIVGARDPGWLGLDGLLYDLALAARADASSARPEDAPVAVIGVDQASLAAPALQDLPRALFAPVWGRLLDDLFAADARAVGFDLLFVWSANRFIPGHDQPLLQALNRHKGKVVLARTGRWPPARPFFFAAGGGRDSDAVAHVELAPDDDGIIRRVPMQLSGADGAVPTLAASLARKAGVAIAAEAVRLAPRRPLTDIPTYSLATVLACAESHPARLSQALAGKVILIGTVLPDEDRKRAPDRFFRHGATQAIPAAGPDCRLEAGRGGREGGTIAGVYLHAEAVSALLGGSGPVPVPVWARAAGGGLGGLAGAVLGLVVAPWLALLLGTAGLALLFGAMTVLLDQGFWLPIGGACIALAVALLSAYMIRYLVEDRRRRQIQSAFSRYLAPSVVRELADSEKPPSLGGETAAVTVMFADLSGFTALSGLVAPDELMRRTNRYLAMIADAVHETGGYVDKFIGDAVMAIWGAPVAQADHASRAVAAATAILRRVAEARARDREAGQRGFAVKVGMNSGPATVGNVGGADRFNYTAVGETVNLAARLEGAPTDYDCRLVVGAETARQAGTQFRFCELDWIRVKGKAEPLTIYQPVAAAPDPAPDIETYLAGYAEALAAYRAGRFDQAAPLWDRLDYDVLGEPDHEGGPPAAMAARARYYVRHGAPEPWDGVWVRQGK